MNKHNLSFMTIIVMALLVIMPIYAFSINTSYDTIWWNVPPTSTVSKVVGNIPIVYTNDYQTGIDTWVYANDTQHKLTPFNESSWISSTIGITTYLDFQNNVWTLLKTGIDPTTQSISTQFYAKVVAPRLVQRLEFVDDSSIILIRSGMFTPNIITNSMANALGSLVQAIDVAPIELSQSAISNGVSFINKYGEDQNAAIEIGSAARAKMPNDYINSLTKTTIVRSVSIAIGNHADAYVENNQQSQAIAIGWHAQAKGSNAIALGNGAQHPDESASNGTGDATYAKAGESIAIGYSAWSTHQSAIAIGGRAKAHANNAIAIGSGEGNSTTKVWTNCVANAIGAVQIGAGTNSTPQSLKFRDYLIVDTNGQIPIGRLDAAAEQLYTNMLAAMSRALQPGNMTVIGNGTEWDDINGQRIEPRLDGLSKVYFQSNTNGIYLGDTTVAVVPPLGSRNYDILIESLPDCYRETTSQLESMPKQCQLNFSQLTDSRHVIIYCDDSIGYTNSIVNAVITNTPCIIKVREVSTNDLFCTIKPWSLTNL